MSVKTSGRCGRVSGLTRRLPRSEVVLDQFSKWLQIPGYSYTFSFSFILRIFVLLKFLFMDSELQVDIYNVSKDPQIHSTFPTRKLIMHHAPSRLMSYFSLPFRRTGFGFPFSFSFLGYHFMFHTISLKTEDFDTFHLSRLVNIQVNGLIAQTSRVEDSPLGTLRACWGSERRLSIEWPRDWITPRAIPVH
jgi:hypothetical protein